MSSKIKVDQIENTDGASDVVFTGTGGISLSSVKLSTIKSSNGTTGLTVANTGIVTASKEIVETDYMIDNWKLNANFNPNSLGLTGNTIIDRYWERFSRTGSAQIGTQMQEASGIFTFPRTGLYLVSFHANMVIVQNASSEHIYIETTTNNLDYPKMVISQAGNQGGGADIDQNIMCVGLVNVTDTTNVKVRFRVDGFETGTYLNGSVNSNAAAGFARTQVFFERKGPAQ